MSGAGYLFGRHEKKRNDPRDEIKQAHDDLDVLDVPRSEGGLTLSVPGRILLMARRYRIERNDLIDQLSYADLRASGGLAGAP